MQELNETVGGKLTEFITQINNCYPPEVVEFYSPNYSKTLLQKIDEYQPGKPLFMSLKFVVCCLHSVHLGSKSLEMDTLCEFPQGTLLILNFFHFIYSYRRSVRPIGGRLRNWQIIKLYALCTELLGGMTFFLYHNTPTN